MARIFRRSKSGPYWGSWTTPTGKRYQRSLRTTDRKVALARLKAAELAETPATSGRKQRLSDAIDHVIGLMHDRAEATRDMYREKGRRIFTTLGDPFVHDVTRDMLSGYIKRRLDPADPVHGQASPHTVSKELITIRRALREAHERGVLAVMPPMPRHSPKYKPKETWLTPEQFEAVCIELEPDRQRWAGLAALAGGSLGEVERVDWATVDLVRDRLRMPGTKRETRDRWVPIAPALKHRLIEVPESERVGLVVRHWGNVRRDLHIAVARANEKATARAAELGSKPPVAIPRVSPNDLRRTFASWLVQQGVPLLTVATLMGHSSTRMVEKVYGKLSQANIDAAIAALPALWTAPTVYPDQAASRLLPPTRCTTDGDPEE